MPKNTEIPQGKPITQLNKIVKNDAERMSDSARRKQSTPLKYSSSDDAQGIIHSFDVGEKSKDLSQIENENKSANNELLEKVKHLTNSFH